MEKPRNWGPERSRPLLRWHTQYAVRGDQDGAVYEARTHRAGITQHLLVMTAHSGWGTMRRWGNTGFMIGRLGLWPKFGHVLASQLWCPHLQNRDCDAFSEKLRKSLWGSSEMMGIKVFGNWQAPDTHVHLGVGELWVPSLPPLRTFPMMWSSLLICNTSVSPRVKWAH